MSIAVAAAPTTHRMEANWRKLEELWVLVVMWALCCVTISIPGRVAPDSTDSMDLLAVAKVIVRLGTLASGFFLLSRHIGSIRPIASLRAFSAILPFWLWAAVSTLWSPVRTISIGQFLGITCLFLFAAIASHVCSNPVFAIRVLKHLTAALTIMTSLILILHLIDPNLSSFDRRKWVDVDAGLLHPTSVGSTAGLTAILLTYLRLSKLCKVPLLFFLPGMLASLWVLLASSSRTALAMTVLALLITVVLFGTRELQAILLLGAAVIGPLYVAADPGFTTLGKTIDKSSEFVTRGQSKEEMEKGSGRMELWLVLVDEFLQSPLIGHGYYSTSTTGYVYVWRQHHMLDAHNVWLQVLVTTGIIGFGLYLVGGALLLKPVFAMSNGNEYQRKLLRLFIIIAIWYLGWGLGCSTFMSAIRPESVVFFFVVAVCVAAAYPADDLAGPNARTTSLLHEGAP